MVSSVQIFKRIKQQRKMPWTNAIYCEFPFQDNYRMDSLGDFYSTINSFVSSVVYL